METDARGIPQGDLRVSDAERDQALGELSEAYQAGRITAEEFDQRSSQALSARTGKQLSVPLADLPVSPAPRRADRHGVPWLTVGASVGAFSFTCTAAKNALRPPLTLQQRTAEQASVARHGISIPVPPAQGFDWIGTLVPAIVALIFIVVVVVRVRTGRASLSPVWGVCRGVGSVTKCASRRE
jgi:hypothetical protein